MVSRKSSRKFQPSNFSEPPPSPTRHMTFGAGLFESLSTCNSAGSCRCILPGEGNQQIPKQQILPENLIPQNSMVDHPFEIAILAYAPCSDQPIWNIDFLNPLIAPALAKVGACGSCGSCGSQTCTEYRNSDLGGESDRERESVESVESLLNHCFCC